MTFFAIILLSFNLLTLVAAILLLAAKKLSIVNFVRQLTVKEKTHTVFELINTVIVIFILCGNINSFYIFPVLCYEIVSASYCAWVSSEDNRAFYFLANYSWVAFALFALVSIL